MQKNSITQSSNIQHGINMGHDHGTLKSYIVGFLLSIILTIIPYYLVTQHVCTASNLIIIISMFGVLQLFVQLVFFLHLNTKSENGWNLIAFIFTVIIITILVVGSLWIMWHLNYNMMEHDMMMDMHKH